MASFGASNRELLVHMNGGKGESSYANNSLLQKKLMLKANHILEETIMRLYCDSSPNCMKVADLGCSVGPNTLLDPSLGSMEVAPLNKGHCHIVSTSPPEVYKAYLKQYQQDFKLFLKSRSDELAPGGAMVLVLLGNHETPRRTVYEPTVEEIKHVIEEEGSFFIQQLEILILPWDEGISEGGEDSSLDGNIKAELMAKHVRAAMEPLMSTKFGAEVITEVFRRYQKKVVQLMEVEKENLECATFMISMTKRA
ncbi:unnamed protein product [Sphenostylis stenocarpa]|uniref:Uncharacterized protein n=1 Tax=Sphenostylis stenocarpa TaxID=92480 RepID=A0AA86RQL2_9FABA|nr:unnamed protein product [Sphenostylis stenocarpa]